MSDRARAIDAALAQAPDPGSAARLAEGVLEAAAPVLDAAPDLDPDALARVLRALCGVAPFLAKWLLREPGWLVELAADDLAAPLDAGALGARLDAALASAGPAAPDVQRALRRFKYRWLARIVVRDCALPLAASGETLADLSRLAEVLLDRALRLAHARVTEQLGPPEWRDAAGRAVAAPFCVLGLGKLGGEELNFSSDVDLVYVYGHVEDAASGPQERAPLDWFMRLGQEFARLVSAETEDRFLYRVDLDLRPEGAGGPLAISDAMLAEYYETVADHWEKVAFMKARPVAGDLALGWSAVRAIHPMIYRAAMDFAGVRRIRAMQQRVSEEHGAARGAGDDDFDVKLDAGGIRDVEFVAQALQLLHGGRIPQLRDRSAQRALDRLAETRVLPAATAAALRHAYLFLRRVENRLQMEDERQVHALPRRPEARLRLARAMGFLGDDAQAAFDAELARQRDCVRAFGASFRIESDAEAILQLFLRHQPQLLAAPETRPMMEALAEQFARAIEASADVVLALNNLDRFVRGIGARRFYYELLIDRPELVGRLAALFAGSRFLSALLAAHPRLIEPLFADPTVLLLSQDALRADLAAIRRDLGGDDEADFERDLEALRLFHHKQVLNVGLLDVDGRVTRAESETALTEIAEVAIEGALAVAQREVARVRGPAAAAARFLVVGMGKLASRELTYGSDLDVIFLYDAGPDADALEAQESCVRVAQRLISALETQTASGACYEIDSRLRPSGNQGTLVTSLASLRAHYEGAAMLWEKQALLRARPVAGDAACAAAFGAIRGDVLRAPLPPDAAAEIHRIRLRMERELAEETATKRDLKRGRGGLLDVENAVQMLQLRHGREHPELLEVDRTERQIERLAALGLLDPTRARVLRDGWEFLERLASRLRVVENRSISDLDEEHGDLDGLARRLGYGGGARESSARRALLDDYARHTRAIRAVYLAILGVSI